MRPNSIFAIVAFPAASLIGPLLLAAEPATERTPAIARYEELRYGIWINFGMLTMASHDCFESEASPLPPLETYDPNELDVDQWIATAKRAGMRYAVLDTKGWHGFCLWDSKHTDYDVAASPNKTDVVAEFVKACRKYGLAPCLSFSFVDVAYQRQGGLIFGKSDEYAKSQMRELLTNYGPITSIWFDGMKGGNFPAERIQYAYETVKSLQPDCLVVMHAPTKVYHRHPTRWPTDVLQLGQMLPPPEGHDPWMKLRGKSHYVPMEVLGWLTTGACGSGRKPARPLATLLDIYDGATNRGANLAMLVWPDRKGRLPADQIERLLELAEAVEQRKE